MSEISKSALLSLEQVLRKSFHSLESSQKEWSGVLAECDPLMASLGNLAEQLRALTSVQMSKTPLSVFPDLEERLRFKLLEATNTVVEKLNEKLKAIEYGRQHEAMAVQDYQKLYNQVDVTYAGLWINPKYHQLAASPDQLIHDPESGPGVLEIKCPYVMMDQVLSPNTLEGLTPSQRSSFCCNLNENGQFVLKRTHKYFYQVQMQMGITERKFCNFVMWFSKGMNVERIHFDSQFWSDTVTYLVKFHKYYLSPEYFLMST